MDIIKNTWFDLVVTAVIVVAAFVPNEYAMWAVYVYSPLMLLMKLGAFMGRNAQTRFKPQDAGVPTIFYHLLYAANFGALVYGALINTSDWWWVAGCWALIWLLSAASGTGKQTKK